MTPSMEFSLEIFQIPLFYYPYTCFKSNIRYDHIFTILFP